MSDILCAVTGDPNLHILHVPIFKQRKVVPFRLRILMSNSHMEFHNIDDGGCSPLTFIEFSKCKTFILEMNVIFHVNFLHNITRVILLESIATSHASRSKNVDGVRL